MVSAKCGAEIPVRNASRTNSDCGNTNLVPKDIDHLVGCVLGEVDCEHLRMPHRRRPAKQRCGAECEKQALRVEGDGGIRKNFYKTGCKAAERTCPG